MLRFTTKTSYGIRALIYLAAIYDAKKPISLNTISKREGISLIFLEQIFHKFKKCGLVKSIRGPKGGYILDKNPSGISIYDVVSVLEGDVYPGQCNTLQGKNCTKREKCASKEVWDELTGQIEKTLKGFTLKYLADRSGEK